VGGKGEKKKEETASRSSLLPYSLGRRDDADEEVAKERKEEGRKWTGLRPNTDTMVTSGGKGKKKREKEERKHLPLHLYHPNLSKKAAQACGGEDVEKKEKGKYRRGGHPVNPLLLSRLLRTFVFTSMRKEKEGKKGKGDLSTPQLPEGKRADTYPAGGGGGRGKKKEKKKKRSTPGRTGMSPRQDLAVAMGRLTSS